ncbi:ABC transporter substrate-binding protein [Amphibacillus cookii]|uniref:ABC transporter substrate-binding protein n=1 Tax=Amphibacillus cookii TaxID=767787 RepID=UPI00195C86B3|nr:extracellular solute-binding protein [Amphibacillus cookii]MBM7541109.1 raffinose/stachyose/melibiose transport system substrate-binding protein [Amphibacillus cookii]
MKKLFMILFVITTLVLIVACGNDADTSETTDEGTNASDDVELKVFIDQPRFKTYYEDFLDGFTEYYEEENGITVRFQLEMPGPNEAAQILQTRLSSNDSPDVFTLHALNNIPVYDNAGYLEDLSDLPFVENLLDAPLNAVTRDEKVLAAPLETLYWGYLYNVDIFEAYDLEVPETISEMETVVETLSENDVTPFIRSFQERNIPQLFLPLVVGALAETENPDFFERMDNNDASLKEFEGFFDMMDIQNEHGTDRPFEIDGAQGSNMFANEEAAMWVQGPWYAESILASNEALNFRVAPLPINDNPEATLINASVSTSLAVSKDSDHKEIAKDLVNYFLESEASNALFQDLLFNPVSTKHDFEPFPWLDEAMEYVEAGRSYQDPPIPNAVKSESERVFQTYLAGSDSQDDVLEALDRTWEQSLALD